MGNAANEALVRLALPSVEHEASFRTMLADYQAAGDREHHQRLQKGTPTEFVNYIQSLSYQASGRALRQGFVPNTMYWLMVGDALVGETNVRHFLTTALLREGGHIGYRITPSWRRQGYGTQILALALEKVKQMGIPWVLLTCDTINVGSARIIQKNGGRFENELKSFHSGNLVSRYWFQTAEEPGEPFPCLTENSSTAPKQRGQLFIFVTLGERLLVMEDKAGRHDLLQGPVLSHETAVNAAWRIAFQQAGLGHLHLGALLVDGPSSQTHLPYIVHLRLTTAAQLPRYHGLGQKRRRLRWVRGNDVVQLSPRQWRLWHRHAGSLVAAES